MEEKTSDFESSEEKSISSPSSDIHFPLPPQINTALCRDEYLKNILPETVEKIRKPESIKMKTVKIVAVEQPAENVEGMGILQMIKTNRIQTFQSSIASTYRCSLSREERLIIYRKFLSQFQVAALEFLSVRMKKQIDTILKVWPGDLTDIPHKLFYWSEENFMYRLKVNQLYLEVITKERSAHELNCAKFCTDLKEIIRLLHAIREDYSNHRDICKNSLQLLKDSNYEVTSNWSEELAALRKIYNDLDIISKQSVIRADKSINLSNMTAKMYDHVATMPIAMRYRINWMHSTEEQIVRYLDNADKKLEEEKESITDSMAQESNAYKLDDYIYQYHIEQYKSAIIHWQQKLDIDLEAAELECNITRSHLSKVKDDLKLYYDRYEMFKVRIQEVNDMLAQEELKAARIAERVAFEALEQENLLKQKRMKHKPPKKRNKY